jgi:hypothetical protein
MLLLIENGADVNTRNQNGETVMDFVGGWQDELLMQLLEEKFDTQAREDERLLASQSRKSILQLLNDYKTE